MDALKKLNTDQKFIILTFTIVVFANLLLPFTAYLILPSASNLGIITLLAQIGDALNGVTGVFGTIYLIKNFNIQTKFNQDEAIEKQFLNRCRAIDKGLNTLSSFDGSKTGSAVLLDIAKQRERGAMTFDQATKALNIVAIHSIASGLVALIRWILKDPSHYSYEAYYRLEYLSQVRSLLNLMDEKHLTMDFTKLLKEFNNDNDKVMLVMALQGLHDVDSDLSAAIIEHEEKQKREAKKKKNLEPSPH